MNTPSMQPSDLLIDIFSDIIDIMTKIIGTCNKDGMFLARYLADAILSYIEEREQELVLSMRYDEWIHIESKARDDIIDKIVEYVNKFAMACRGESLDETIRENIKNVIRQNNIIERVLCYFYRYGIYGDGISRYILIKNVPLDRCEETLSNNNDIEVRSRFIEIARNLYMVKQRFPDRSSFEAKPLVDRVFAYVEPRNLPLGKIHPLIGLDRIKNYVEDLYIMYNKVKLNRECSPQELQVLDNVLREFFNRIHRLWEEPLLFYDYQVRGVEKLVKSMIEALREGKIAINIIEAPTGAGKTEVFVLALLILAFIRRLALYYAGKEYYTPAAIIVYPRLALASNQIDRLLKYLYEINNIISSYPAFRSRDRKPIITLSMNYTEVRFKREYENAILKYMREVQRRGKIDRLAHRTEYGIKVYIGIGFENGKFYIELKYFKCPNGAYPRIIYDPSTNRLITDKVYCRDIELDYLRITKDDVKDKPGDIHVTLFETLRQNLWSKSWNRLFGIPGFDGPLVFVLDEIHTYVGIRGARYAYVLRRVLSRIRHQVCDRQKGFVIVGVSATIPNPEEFLQDLLMEKVDKTEEVFIRIDEKETIPMGNEYFFIVVPTMKYTVNPLTVSIQTIMTLFYNLPPFLGRNREYNKKALVFIDNLDVVARTKHDLQDAVERNRIQGHCTQTPYGLQDLRNPFNPCFNITNLDYRDNIPNDPLQFNLGEVHRYSSWKDGELWWPYATEYYSLRQRFTKVIEYTSKRREKIEEGHLIVTTSTLEVGIDYKDVVLIYQHGVPPNISALIQRAGRAGRRIFRNPLIRTAVAIQLSPDIPMQASYFEIFTRVKSLREALKYDRLYVATHNEYVVKQTLLETVIDYLVYKSIDRCTPDRTFESFSTTIFDIVDFECNKLPSLVKQALNRFRDELYEYLSQVFPYHRNKILDYLNDILIDIEDECKYIIEG